MLNKFSNRMKGNASPDTVVIILSVPLLPRAVSDNCLVPVRSLSELVQENFMAKYVSITGDSI